MSGLQKIVRKSMYWHSHGKHSTIPPHLRPERKRRAVLTEWFGSVREAFAAAKKDRR